MPYKDKDKQRKYQREWAQKNGDRARKKKYKKLRAIIIKAKNVPCADCGEKYPYYVMDFHHVDPSKKNFTMNKHGNRGIEVILAEIEKCIVLCANCHRMREHK